LSCTTSGEKGSIYRREGLYTSQVSNWRKQRMSGSLSALGQNRGRKKQALDSQQVQSLEKEVANLKVKLAQAESIIDIQKKVSEIFGISNPDKGNSENR